MPGETQVQFVNGTKAATEAAKKLKSSKVSVHSRTAAAMQMSQSSKNTT